MPALAPVSGLLGDTSARDYAAKLQLFNAFAEPELRDAIASLKLEPGSRVLDAGCGTGEALRWLSSAVAPDGTVLGIDLAAAHVAAASAQRTARVQVLQADLLDAPCATGGFDMVWCVNTLNHLRDPVAGLRKLNLLLRPGGRVVLGQSALLPDMYFAWDARLERVTNEAVRRYYRERYALSEQALSGVRSLVGWMRAAGLRDIAARSMLIERLHPLPAATHAYLLEAIFRDTWGERLRPYLSATDFAELADLCDPDSPRFALHRPDFHLLQTFTIVTGQVRQQ